MGSGSGIGNTFIWGSQACVWICILGATLRIAWKVEGRGERQTDSPQSPAPLKQGAASRATILPWVDGCPGSGRQWQDGRLKREP